VIFSGECTRTSGCQAVTCPVYEEEAGPGPWRTHGIACPLAALAETSYILAFTCSSTLCACSIVERHEWRAFTSHLVSPQNGRLVRT
jgi:hypothetical protein